MSEVSDKLENRISESLDSLRDASVGSDEYKATLKEIQTLYNLKNKSDELQIREARDWEQLNADRDKQEAEHELREKQIDVDLKKLKIQEARDWEQLNADRDNQEAEHELREKQIDVDLKKLKHEKVGFWAGLGVTAGITIGALIYENKGGLIPRPIKSLLDKVTRRM